MPPCSWPLQDKLSHLICLPPILVWKKLSIMYIVISLSTVIRGSRLACIMMALKHSTNAILYSLTRQANIKNDHALCRRFHSHEMIIRSITCSFDHLNVNLEISLCCRFCSCLKHVFELYPNIHFCKFGIYMPNTLYVLYIWWNLFCSFKKTLFKQIITLTSRCD